MKLFEFLKLNSDCLLCGGNIPFESKKDDAKKNIPHSKTSNKICVHCHQKLPVIKQACFVCGLPSPTIDTPCGECLNNSPPYDQTISAFHYEQPISNFITQFKYGARLDLLPIMTNYLTKAVNSRFSSQADHSLTDHRPSLLLPIPLHYKKRNIRGFNQSRLIAESLSKAFNIPVSGNEIARIKQTKTQASLDAKERRKNLKNAFKIECQLPESIAIIDDIITTGTTVSELASQASKQGAKKIQVWSLARAYTL